MQCQHGKINGCFNCDLMLPLIGVMVLATALLLGSGCSRAPMNVPYEVQTYVDGYIARFGGDIQLVSIHFKEQMDSVAWCSFIDGHIDIHRQAFEEASDLQRQYIVWHELGHCLSGLGHTTTTDQHGCPTSFMHDGYPTYGCMQKLLNGGAK